MCICVTSCIYVLKDAKLFLGIDIGGFESKEIVDKIIYCIKIYKIQKYYKINAS